MFLVAAHSAVAQTLPWRNDYAAARREAQEKNLPLLLDFGTRNCLWCRKLDETTFRDPLVDQVLGQQFIPLKVDADREPSLTHTLGVRSFPTLVFAGPDGRILGMQEGYITAAELLKKLQLTLVELSRPNPANLARDPGGSPLVAPGSVAGATYVANPEAERARMARDHLAQVLDDFRKQLAAQVKGDPELSLQVCAELSNHLGELYLALAEAELQQGQPLRAISYLQRVLQVNPGSRQAQIASAELTRLQQPPAGTAPTQQ
jgi:hypothetical protein